MIKNYFRILKKPHAYLQTILKTPVKFQKDRTETVGGVKGTKYLLKTRNHAPRTTRHAPRATRHAPRTTPHGKPKTVSLHFSSKRRGTTRGLDIPGRFFTTDYKEDNFCDFLFAFLQIVTAEETSIVSKGHECHCTPPPPSPSPLPPHPL